MINVRTGLFETNSSSEHAMTVRYKDVVLDREIGEYDDDFVITDDEFRQLLRGLSLNELKEEIKRREEFRESISSIPTSMLEEEIENRKKLNEYYGI